MRVGRWVLLAALCTGACGDDPAGPGTYQARVRASTVVPGAVIVEVTGTGIVDMNGAGGTDAFWARTGGTEGGSETFRVVLVKEPAGELNFSVAVSDLDDPAPRAVVVSAVHANNVPVGDLNGFSVELIR